eukprot:5770900-Amphidinium_carterae.1
MDARKCWLRSLNNLGFVDGLFEIPEFQPFLLRAVGVSLRVAGDPDWRVMAEAQESYANGVPV